MAEKMYKRPELLSEICESNSSVYFVLQKYFFKKTSQVKYTLKQYLK